MTPLPTLKSPFTSSVDVGESLPIPTLPSDLMWILVGLSVPVVNNKSWWFVPPDFMFGVAPDNERNASGKPDRTYIA